MHTASGHGPDPHRRVRLELRPLAQGAFYPESLPQRRELEYASRRFNSLEIKGSFYSLLKPETYRRYRETAPDGFVFAVKGSQFITHSAEAWGEDAG